MTTPRSLFAELKRRNVLRAAALYAAGAWLLVQIATQVGPVFDIPSWVQRWIVIALVLGFPLAVVLSWFYEIGPGGLRRESDAAPATPRQPSKALDRAIIVVLAVAVVLLGADRLVLRNGGDVGVDDKSIAVLPFENLSADPGNAFFAEDMQDEILTKLTKISALKVISGTSTRRYASRPDNLPEIARQLGVAHVIEGSVQKAGDAVHINVQLIRAASDEHLRTESYDRTLENVFSVQGDVAEAVASALEAKLTGAERRVVAAKGTENPKAFEAYLRGRSMDNAGYSFIELEKAIDHYLEAVREDPQFAQAWSAIAVAMSGLYQNGYDAERSTPEAIRNAADTAMRLQPDTAESLVARGAYLYRVERDYSGAIDLYKRARDEQPGDANILSELFFVERRFGRWNDAISHYTEAIELDPRNVSVLVQGARETYFWLRRFDETRTLLERAIEIAPYDTTAPACLALLEQRLGRLDAADAWLKRVPIDSGDFYEEYAHIDQWLLTRRYADLIARMEPVVSHSDDTLTNVELMGLIWSAYAERWSGQDDRAHASFERLRTTMESTRRRIDRVTDLGPTTPLIYAGLGAWESAIAAAEHQIELNRNDSLESAFARITLAEIHALKGDGDAAIALLPELLEIPAGLTPAQLALHPMWDTIRDDPRFVELTKRPLTPYEDAAAH
jgi:TolB-like protein/Tfp pilus assembly protein PilF